MAVYEHTYKPYAGKLTPGWSRFLIIPRHAYKDIFQSKIFTGFFALCFVCPLVFAILIYLHHNVSAMAILEVNVADLVPIDGSFFRAYVTIQQSLAFLLTIIIGPALVSRDLANNALPLYLCRPFTRAEYVLGKTSVLVILISAVTWVPGLLLYLFQSYLQGAGWFASNLWMAAAVFVSSWIWIIILALLSITLSAWVKWRMAAGAAIFAVFIIPNVMGMMINGLFRTRWGSLINLSVLTQTVSDGLFRQPNSMGMPPWMVLPTAAAWIALLAFCAMCLFLLSRKVRAYEVVK